MRYGKVLVVLGLLAALICAAGCGRQGQPGKPAQPAKVQAGGQLIYGSMQEPNTLNPLMSDLLASAELGSLLFSGLVQLNEKGEWIADLASDVPTLQNGGVSPDGLTVVYRLRYDVKWHDGTPFTAEDVKFTWQMIMNPKVHVISREGYDKIAAVNAPDPYTVVVKFREFYAPYMTLFSTIMPRHILANAGDINKSSFNRMPVGTGPFMLKEWRIAEAIVLEANPSYYRGNPLLDGIVYKIIPDSNIMLTQLKTGEVDIFGNIGALQIEQVRAIDGVRTVVTPNSIWEHLDFNLDCAIFQDVRVRKAIVLGIDRAGIATGPLKGLAAAAAADQPPLSWAHNPTLPVPARDLETARALLTQAGWKQGPDGIFAKDGQRLAFGLAITAGNKTREAVAQDIAQQLKELGVAVEVRPVDAQTFFAAVLKNRRFDTALYAVVGGLDPHNENLWHSKNIPGPGNGYTGQNYCGWRNAEVDALVERAARTVDVETRKQLYFRLQDLVIQETPVVPLYFRASVDAVRNTVVNYKPNSVQGGTMWNAWEWGLTRKR